MSQMWPNEDDLILFWLRNGEPLSADNIMRVSKEIYQRLLKQAEAGLLASCLIPITAGNRSLLEPRVVLPSIGTIDKLQTGTPLITGIALGGTTDTISLGTDASSLNDYYNGWNIRITDGTGITQVRTIISYLGGTVKRATVSVAWTTIPDITSCYQLSYRNLSDDDIVIIGNNISKGSEILSYEVTWPTVPSENTDYWIYYGQDKILASQEVSADPAMSDPNKLYIAQITREKITGIITYVRDLRGFSFWAQDSKNIRFTPGTIRVYGTVGLVEDVGGVSTWIIGNGARWSIEQWTGKTIYFLSGVKAGYYYPIIATRAYTSESSMSAVQINGVVIPSAGDYFVIIDTRISGDSVYDGLLHHRHEGGNDGEPIVGGIADAAVTIPKLDNFVGVETESKVFVPQTIPINTHLDTASIALYPYGRSQMLIDNMLGGVWPGVRGMVETVKMGPETLDKARGSHQIFWFWVGGDGDPVSNGSYSAKIRYWKNEIPLGWGTWTEFHEGKLTVTTEKLAADSVTKEKINADVAGFGITQDTDGSLKVAVDDSTLEAASNIFRIKAAGVTENEVQATIYAGATIVTPGNNKSINHLPATFGSSTVAPTTPLSSFPVGVSFARVTNGLSRGWLSNVGTLMTFKSALSPFTHGSYQIFSVFAPNETPTDMAQYAQYIRYWKLGYAETSLTGWTDWQSLTGFPKILFKASKEISTTGGYTDVTVYTQLEDLSVNFNVNTGVFIAPIAGRYVFNIWIDTWKKGSSIVRYLVKIMNSINNGASWAAIDTPNIIAMYTNFVADGGNTQYATGSAMVSKLCVLGEQIKLQTFVADSTSGDLSNNLIFGGKFERYD